MLVNRRFGFEGIDSAEILESQFDFVQPFQKAAFDIGTAICDYITGFTGNFEPADDMQDEVFRRNPRPEFAFDTDSFYFDCLRNRVCGIRTCSTSRIPMTKASAPIPLCASLW